MYLLKYDYGSFQSSNLFGLRKYQVPVPGTYMYLFQVGLLILLQFSKDSRQSTRRTSAQTSMAGNSDEGLSQ